MFGENRSLKLVKDDAYFPWYKSLYRDFHGKYPELKDWVPECEKDTLEHSRSEGLLYYIMEGQSLAGLIALETSDYLGMSSVYFNEIVISEKFRRRHFGSYGQAMLLAKLKDRFKCAWGTIDFKNTSSTKTALRCGRKVVREEYFLPILHLLHPDASASLDQNF